jgi:long-chain fatty acid transport protein
VTMKVSVSKLSAAIAIAVISTGVSTGTQAAGFALIENSASGMGNAFAGGSAIAEDASTVWFNPAGMTRLSGSQMAIAGHIVAPGAEFANNGSTNGAAGALSGNDDDGGTSAFVPNFYYTKELGNDSYFGIGITVPFGLSTEYDESWIGRYTATKSEVLTMNINPSFASKATDKLSIGFGLNIQYIEATLANHLDSAAICQVALSGGGGLCNANNLTAGDIGVLARDSSQSLTGDDISFGWNFGFLYDLDKDSRLGIAYRSSIKHSLEGNVDFTRGADLNTVLTTIGGGTNLLFTDTPIQASIELPESLSVSYYRDIDSKLSIMADITWTKWRNFENLTIVFGNLAQPVSTTPEDWDNNYRFSFGINYKPDSKLTYRAGVAYDETPIKSAEARTPRIPGNNRTWLSFGIGYNLATDMSIDIGYSHLFVNDTDINNADAASGSTLIGTYEADVDILSAQANFKF